jgi:hypothetical protein
VVVPGYPCRVPESSPHPDPSAHGRDRGRIAAAAVCLAQALFLLGFCVFSLVELAGGGSDDAVRVVMEVLLIALFAGGLLALARGWLVGRNWPNTPTIVWNGLLLPVAWGLVQGGRGWVGLLVAGVAVGGIVAAVAADTGEAHDVPGTGDPSRSP